MSNNRLNPSKTIANKKTIVTLFFVGLFFSSLAQQDNVYRKDSPAIVSPVPLQDTLNQKDSGKLHNFPDDTLKIKKRFWRSSGELLLVEVVPWAYNYFIR